MIKKIKNLHYAIPFSELDFVFDNIEYNYSCIFTDGIVEENGGKNFWSYVSRMYAAKNVQKRSRNRNRSLFYNESKPLKKWFFFVNG